MVIIWLMMVNSNLVGGIPIPYPSEKWWTSSVGTMKFPIWWESHSKFHGSSRHQAVVVFFHQPVVAMIMIYKYFLIFKSNMMKNHVFLHELLSILSTSSWCLHCPTRNPRRVSAEWHLYVARPERIPRNRRPESHQAIASPMGIFGRGFVPGMTKKGQLGW